MASHLQLSKQAVEWLTSSHELLVNICAEYLERHGPVFMKEARYEIANSHVSGLIQRIGGEAIPADLLKQRFLMALQHGAPIKNLLDANDNLQQLVNQQVARSLTDQLELRDWLIQKITYVSQIIKSAMASALIEFEATKPLT